MAVTKKRPLIFAGRESRTFARRVAKQLELPLGKVEVATFSDLETHVIVEEDVKGRDVYIIQATSMPANENLMELLIMTHALKSMSPKRITAVMPFFGYRRQEKTTVNGESLTFELVAKILKTAGISRVLTMDLHKHRSAKYFTDAGIISKELRAFEVIVKYFRRKKLENFVIVAPDKGSIPESERYAKALGVPLVKAYKHRAKRDQVVFDSIDGDVAGKNILIIDDEVNTAGTLCGVVDILKKKKARNVYFACTHAVLSGPAMERLTASRIRQVVVTDTIYLEPDRRINKIKILTVAPLIAEQIATWTKRR